MENSTPKRIQRKRTKGWKMPENTIYVGRGSRWGNPFRIIQAITGKWMVVIQYDDPILQDLVHSICEPEYETRNAAAADAILCYGKWLIPYEHGDSMDVFYQSQAVLEEAKTSLSGKNLACWCKEGDICHADFLLKLVN